MLRLWLRNRRRGVGALAIALLALLVLAVIVLDRSEYRLTALGNAAAPRPVAATSASEMLPRSGGSNAQPDRLPDSPTSLLDSPASASAAPQDIAAAQAAWSATEITDHQQVVLDALSCARHERGQPSLTLDPALSQAAGVAWLKLMHDRSFSLLQLPGTYASRSILVLDFSNDSAHNTTLSGQNANASSSCQIGGLEAALPAAGTPATRVGLAVFPPQAAWDSASAVVLVQ